MFFISNAYAQTAAAGAAGGDFMSVIKQISPMIVIFVAMFFLMIRPQMKRQKEHRSMIEALAKGDEVATAGGIIGTVTAWPSNSSTSKWHPAWKSRSSALLWCRCCPRARPSKPACCGF